MIGHPLCKLEIYIRSEPPQLSVFLCFELIFTWYTTTSRRFIVLKSSVMSHLKCRSTLIVELVSMGRARGNSLIFFSYTFLEITKKSHTKSQNHKKNHILKHQKSQITEKLLKNHTKKSLEITKITKNHREKIM